MNPSSVFSSGRLYWVKRARMKPDGITATKLLIFVFIFLCFVVVGIDASDGVQLSHTELARASEEKEERKKEGDITHTEKRR